MTDAAIRDYSLVGPSAEAAKRAGLVHADWYRTPLPRETLRALMQKSDGPAMRDTAIWLGALVLSGAGMVAFWGGWLCLPFVVVYGVLYGSATDSRWHECGHRTAFKTGWMNDAVYQLASFMIMREPEVTRWRHARHHTDTLIVGRDPEIAAKRPPNLIEIALSFLAAKGVAQTMLALLRHAAGRLDAEEATFLPATETPKVVRTARVWLAVHGASLAAALAMGSWLPLMLVGVLPTMYGAWLQRYFGYTQHAGLAENVLDHRLNARTVMMNPVFRFLYWNMNYHVEHHMFPIVPYHRLPELHALVKHDMPRPYASTIEAYSEIIPAWFRQRRDPEWGVVRELPPDAGRMKQAAVKMETT